MRRIVLASRAMVTLLLTVLTLLGDAYGADVQSPLSRSALQVRAPLDAVLLDVTYAGERLVAVGERGIVLLSDDHGGAWRQARVPASVTLTRVRFASPMSGWAVGHYGVVLHSSDGGETWERQLDGVEAAQLALEAAQARLHSEPDDTRVKRSLTSAERLVQDGPDKPFLDLHVLDDQHVVVVGAFNLIFMTADGGKSWFSLRDRLDNPREMHLYAVDGVGDSVYIAGEQGVVFLSEDRGHSFVRLTTPYSGSYFSASVLRPGEVLLAGLRGNAFHSADAGETWEKLEGAPPVSFSAITRLESGQLLLANHAGQFFERRGSALKPIDVPHLPPLAAIVQLSDGALIGVGVRGMARVSLAKQGEN